MPLYMLVQITYGYKDNVGLFDSQAKALAAQTSLELENFDSGGLCGISFEIEEWYAK